MLSIAALMPEMAAAVERSAHEMRRDGEGAPMIDELTCPAVAPEKANRRRMGGGGARSNTAWRDVLAACRAEI